MNAIPAFQQAQRRMLAYLRRPGVASAPEGFAPERLAVYADLLYNKFDDNLAACFPIVRRILTPGQWRALLLDFIAEHRCLTPYYRRIPDEFVAYLQHGRNHPGDRPFLAELAHFEWVDLYLSVAEAETVALEPLSEAQLLAEVPMFVPVRQWLEYRWPVQALGPDYLPAEPPAENSIIFGFRDVDDHVQFIALKPLTARLMLLLEEGLTGQQALDILSEGFDGTALTTFTRHGLQAISEFHRRGAIVNTRPPEQP